MAKRRYHQSRRDRMHERMGEERHMERMRHDRMDEHMGEEHYLHERPEERSKHQREHFNDEIEHERGNERAVYRRFRAMGPEHGFYAGMEPRRRQEMEDAGYIHEDHNAIANLPQQVMMKPYPRTGPYLPEGLEDSIRGVDHQMDYDDNKRREHFYPKKV